MHDPMKVTFIVLLYMSMVLSDIYSGPPPAHTLTPYFFKNHFNVILQASFCLLP